MFRFILAFLLTSLLSFGAELVSDVRAAAAAGNYTRALGYIETREARTGQSSESILARSWLGRTALAQGNYEDVDSGFEERIIRRMSAKKDNCGDEGIL